MAASFHLQIVTPDGLKLDEQVESVVVRTTEGDVCILKNHIPYMAALAVGRLRVKLNGENRDAAVADGFISTNKELTTVVAGTFEWKEDIDVERAKRARDGAKAMLEKETDPNSVKLGKYRLSKARNRIRVAGAAD